MFYNGAVRSAQKGITTCLLVLNFFALLNNNSLKKLQNVQANDSILVLYLLSVSNYALMSLAVITLVVICNQRWTTNSPPFRHIGAGVLILIITYFGTSYANSTFVGAYFATPRTNVGLQNGLLNIHPSMVYSSYAFTIVLVFVRYGRMGFYQTGGHMTVLYNYVIYVLIGILLGSWWASQELNWGGFWSWDPVELVSLIILFYYIRIIHNSKVFFFFKTPLYLLSGVFTIVYIILRLGVLTTIHSFVSSKTQTVYGFVILQLVGFGYISWLIINYKNYELRRQDFYIISTARASKAGILAGSYTFWFLNAVVIYIVFVLFQYKTSLLGFRFDQFISIYVYMLLLTSIGKYMLATRSSMKNTFMFCLVFVSSTIVLSLHRLIIILFLFSIFVANVPKQKVTFHAILLVSYSIFLCFFTPVPVYNSLSVIFVNHQVATGGTFFNASTYSFHESNYHVFLSTFMYKFKQVCKHILTLSSYFNGFTTLYFFKKNSRYAVLFSEDFLLITLLFFLFFLVVNAYAYFTTYPQFKLY